MPKVYEIWVEGYAATGEHGTARLIGKAEGDTFQSAVFSWLEENPDYEKKYGNFRITHERMFLWGCELFSSEIESRKSFG